MEKSLEENRKSTEGEEPAKEATNETSSREENFTEQSYTPNIAQYEESSAATQNSSTATIQGSSIVNAGVMVIPNDAIPPAKYKSMTHMTAEFWREKKQKMMDIREEDMLNKTKNMSVPMARVKKIMRIDDDVRQYMIASDAPIFMAQAAEFFIEEMTAMGWQYVSEARRRILQKSDIASAVQKSDQFDFLIDFLPSKNSQNPSMPPSFSYPSNSGEPPTNSASFSHENGQNSERKVSFSEEKQDRTGFKCVSNETSRGTEYHVTPTTSAGTSSTPTTSSSEQHFVAPTTPPVTSASRPHQNGSISK